MISFQRLQCGEISQLFGLYEPTTYLKLGSAVSAAVGTRRNAKAS